MNIRYFFGKDNSGHDYLVEAEKRNEWYTWLNLPEDDEKAWTEPPYATRLNTGLEHYSFELPRMCNISNRLAVFVDEMMKEVYGIETRERDNDY